MKKILNSFKSLYEGEDAVKKHLLFALLFILPSIAAASFQMIDKDEKTMIIPLLIMGSVFLVLSIIPILMINGTFINFLNRNLQGKSGIPDFGLDMLKQGVKILPVNIVWGIYIGIPMLFYLAFVIGGFAFMLTGDSSTIAKLSSVFIMFGLIFILWLLLFIITPFVTMVYIKYGSTLEYSKEIFNPLMPFRYMKKAFKDTMIVALKYFVVNAVLSTILQIISFLIMLIVFAFSIFIASLASNLNSSLTTEWIIMPATFIISAIFIIINGYTIQIINFSLSDNLIDIYKDKIESSETTQNEETMADTQQ